MRFRITEGWRLGDALVPAETIIDLAGRPLEQAGEGQDDSNQCHAAR